MGERSMKKTAIIGFLAVLMLVTISFASAVSTNTNTEKKESPLFRIRTKQSVGEKIGRIIENIKTKFIGDRIFFLPGFTNTEEVPFRQILNSKWTWLPGCYHQTWEFTVIICYC